MLNKLASASRRSSVRSPVRCQYCLTPAKLVSAGDLYPNRPDLRRVSYYHCVDCQAWVRCHRGTTIPLGSLANKALRHGRQAAHQAFDPLWRTGLMRRAAAYAWLGRQLCRPPGACHIASLSEAECDQVIMICANIRLPLSIREHGQDRPADPSGFANAGGGK